MYNITYCFNDCQVLLSRTAAVYLPFRMNAEDPKIQPPRKKKNLPLNGSKGNGEDIILQQENGVLQAKSLPTLLGAVPSDLDSAFCVPESNTDITTCKDEDKALIKVMME